MSRRGRFLGAWTRSSPPERLEAYTRWSVYVLSSTAPLFILWIVGLSVTGAGPEPVRPQLLRALLVLVLLHTVACIALLRRGFTQFLGGPPVPRWLVPTVVGLALVGLGLALLIFPPADLTYMEGNGRDTTTFVLIGFTFGACAPLLTFRRLALAAVLVGALTAVVHLVGLDATADDVGFAVGQGVGITFSCLGIFASYRVSVWMLGVVWELERTRVLHARLAVAEERLRFSRDLHDVFGRTLSVVAVKSELAAELAVRGRAGAADQMLEVRRIAQDALRDMRAVVAGYRSADLAAELAGARSVLRSAGIDTTVEGEAAGVGAPVQEALAWVVREGVTNVVRHSSATRCAIVLRREGHASVLEIANDGVSVQRARPTWASAELPVGSDMGSDGVRGSGLTGLAERLADVDGEITTRREDDCFALVARVPDQGARVAEDTPIVEGAHISGDAPAAREAPTVTFVPTTTPMPSSATVDQHKDPDA